MECTIQSMAEAGATGQSSSPSSMDPAAIPSGKVGQVCREWLVREDGVLAYQLQNEEINKHYEGNRSKNQVVRSDLHQAKSLQEYEYQEMMGRYERELEEQMKNDARIAAQIQEQEICARDVSKSGLQRQESIVERDRLIAERLQAKERMKVLKYKLLKEKRQVERVASGSGLSILERVASGSGLSILERVASGSGLSNDPSTLNDNHPHDSDANGITCNGNHGRNRFRSIHDEDIVDIPDLTEFCMKPPDDLTEEEKRIFVEEQDGELARFLQKQEVSRNQGKKNMIESHDAVIARILQEQEKIKGKKLREKARQRAIQRQQLQDSSIQSDGNHAQSNSTNSTNSQSHGQNNQNQYQRQVIQYHQRQVIQEISSTHSPISSSASSHSSGCNQIQHTPVSSGCNQIQHTPVSSGCNQIQQTPVSGYHSHSHHQQDEDHNPSQLSIPSLQVQSTFYGINSNNPLRNSNGSGSHSPHCINNNNCCHIDTLSSHCHTRDNLDTLGTSEEEDYDDENPIVDRYYPVGDDLKRMNQSSQRFPDGRESSNGRPSSGRSAGKVTSSDVSKSSNFHNIAMDLDPTYNRGATSHSPSNGRSSGGRSSGGRSSTGQSSTGQSSTGQGSSGHPAGQTSEADVNGLHFAHLCRVSPTSDVQRNGVQPVSNLTRTRNRSGEEIVSINPAILPVPGHRRQDKKKNKKMADGCKQQ